MISNKARYAFRALLAIAGAPGGQTMTSADIAQRYAIPHKFLEQILVDLKKAGILDSRGIGYALPPADVTEGGFLKAELGQTRQVGDFHANAAYGDLFLRKLPVHAGDELADVLMSRYETCSTIITSNRPFDDWAKLLGDVVVVTPLLDRLMHHGHLLKFEGKSWRLKEAAARIAKHASSN